MVYFDPSRHVYTDGGKVLPSVTQIISKVLPRQWNADDWSLRRGQMVHKAIAMHLDGCLDMDTVDDRIKARVLAAVDACRVMDWRPGYVEKIIAHPVMGYAGMPDFVTDGAVIVDWKGTVEATAELQLGGYACLVEVCGIKVKGLYGVQTTEAGYKFAKYDVRRAKAYWVALYGVYGWMVKNGL
jgi:hypothetical protein